MISTKLILSFCLVLILQQINNVVSQSINFTPVYMGPNGVCANYGDEAPGVGYSIKIGFCFTLDNETSHLISYGKSKDTYIHTTYSIGANGAADCTTSGSSYEFEEESCVQAFNFNYVFSYFNSDLYVNVTFIPGQLPWESIPSNSYVTSLSGFCSDQDVMLLEYLASGSSVEMGNDTDNNYYCKKSVPFVQQCNTGIHSSGGCTSPVNTQVTCLKQQQTNIYKTIYCSS
ncbi:hypothetical protein RB653_007104 [Dictyostelium firmibasis]|uniref:Uncharacterized protein n=1 Tax=Dictyostelium firmibasis TaxID=79012 RepID=A0AAN7TUW3_9MYCE